MVESEQQAQLEGPEKEPSCVNDQIIPDLLTKEQKDMIKDFTIRETYFDGNQEDDHSQFPHCVIKNEKLNGIDAKERAKRFEALIKLLARSHCICPSNEVMKSCAFALTGIGFKALEPKPVYWNPEKVDILLFVCQKFYNSGERSATTDFKTALEVFHVSENSQKLSNKSAEGSKVNDAYFGKDFNKIYPEL